MKIKVGVMGSASNALAEGKGGIVLAKAEALGRALAEISASGTKDSYWNRTNGIPGKNDSYGLVLLTGATTGLPNAVVNAARNGGLLHVGISPAADFDEHINRYGLPAEGCDVLVYTGFGLKGRNVVLVRSCDIVLFISGSMGSLNELTIAYDEGRVIGCLTGTGGVADEAERMAELFAKPRCPKLIKDSRPDLLVRSCLREFLIHYPSRSKSI